VISELEPRADVTVIPGGVPVAQSTGAPDTLRRLLRRPTAVASLVWLVGITVASFLAPLIAVDPQQGDLDRLGQGPTWSHLLGTDQLGRDILSRLLHGGVDAIVGAALCVAVAVVLGVSAGVVAGFAGGVVEVLASFVSDVLQTMPGVIVMLLALSLLGADLNIGMIVLGVLLSASFYHLARTSTKAIRRELFVDAASVSGLTPARIVVSHILPNIRQPIVVQATVTAAVGLLLQAGLSFLGQGPPPPAPEWGSMVQEGAQQIFEYPWMIFPSGGVIIVTALAFNLLGDAVNDTAGPQTAGAGEAFARRRPPRHARLERPASAPPDADAPLLEVEGLTVAFTGEDDPVVVVDDVGLSLRAGETLALVGESGSGKTMTALAIMGLLPPGAEIVAGRVRFAEHELDRLGEAQLARLRGAEIAMISQEPVAALDPSFTVGSQIREPLRRHASLGREAASRRAIELLEQVGIPQAPRVARAYPHELSGGMAQRVAIAIALAGRPRLLIADEPTTALDVTVQAEILDLLRDLQAQTGVALLLVTHDWGVVADAASRVAVMYASQIVEQATAAEVFARPLHPYSAALLRATPSRARSGAALPTIPGTVPPVSRWPRGCRFQNRCALASDDCGQAPIPLLEPEPGRRSRCIHTERLGEGRR
jgi:peptide/nickel transport system permease protein